MQMFPAQRRREMLHLVQERGTVKISELSKIFQVSEMTIHRDLIRLQESGLLQKTYGGAVATYSLSLEPDFAARSRASVAEKADIGLAASEFVKEGDCILADASTTCLAMVRHLRARRELTVFTTGIYPLLELTTSVGVTVHASGGMLSKHTMSYVGPHTVEFLDSIHVDKCFIGANSIDVEQGITDPYVLEAEIKRKSVTVADQVFLLADHTKFGRTSMIRSVPLSRIDIVITDGRSPNPYLSNLDKLGIQYVIAAESAAPSEDAPS